MMLICDGPRMGYRRPLLLTYPWESPEEEFFATVGSIEGGPAVIPITFGNLPDESAKLRMTSTEYVSYVYQGNFKVSSTFCGRY